MEKILDIIYREKHPPFLPTPEYIGKTFQGITQEHTDYKVIPYISRSEELLILEIRSDNATISCILKDDICIESYLFDDK